MLQLDVFGCHTEPATFGMGCCLARRVPLPPMRHSVVGPHTASLTVGAPHSCMAQVGLFVAVATRFSMMVQAGKVRHEFSGAWVAQTLWSCTGCGGGCASCRRLIGPWPPEELSGVAIMVDRTAVTRVPEVVEHLS